MQIVQIGTLFLLHKFITMHGVHVADMSRFMRGYGIPKKIYEYGVILKEL